MRSRRGMTLIELLVVVAVIGLLAALLLPAIQASRQRADMTRCANNLHQIGLAITLYANDHRGNFPGTFHGGDDTQSWVYTLAPYLEKIDGMRICPQDPNGRKRLEHKGTSYVINEYVSLPGPDSILKLSKLRDTSHTMTVLEGADRRDPTSFYFEHCHPSGWFTPSNITQGWVWPRALLEIQPDRHWSSGSTDQTGGVAHYLYADGHVEVLSALAIKKWCTEGHNFAKPFRD